MLVEVSDSSIEFMNITFSFYVNSKHWLCNDDGKVAGIYIQGLHVHWHRRLFMLVPLDVPPDGPTYVHLKTVSRHFGAETKSLEKWLTPTSAHKLRCLGDKHTYALAN